MNVWNPLNYFNENKLRPGEKHALLRNVNRGKNKWNSRFLRSEFMGPGSQTETRIMENIGKYDKND